MIARGIERAAVTGAAHADDRSRDGDDVERSPPRGLVDRNDPRRGSLLLAVQPLVVTRDLDSLVANKSLLARLSFGLQRPPTILGPR